MSDDVEAGLAALMERAPETQEPVGPVPQQGPAEGAAPEPQQPEPEPQADPKQQQREPLSLEEKAKRYEQSRGAIREERQQRRALEQQVREAKERADQLEQTWARVQQQLAQRQQQPQYDPYQQQDPGSEYDRAVQVMWEERNEWQRQENLRIQQERQQQARLTQEQREFSELQRRQQEYEADFREDHPDYDDAMTHLYEAWDAQYEQFGYSPEQRGPILQNLARTVAKNAIERGADPAAAVYNAAKRLGFGAQQPKQPQAQQPAADPLATLKQGLEASRTLSGGGSSIQGEGLSLASISKLDGAAFDAAMERLRRESR